MALYKCVDKYFEFFNWNLQIWCPHLIRVKTISINRLSFYNSDFSLNITFIYILFLFPKYSFMVFSCFTYLSFNRLETITNLWSCTKLLIELYYLKNVFRENKRSSEPDIGLFGLIFWKIGLPLSDPSVSWSSCLADSLTVALLWWRWAAGSCFVSRKGL